MGNVGGRVEIPYLAQQHLWCISYHIIELFKFFLPEEDNHVIMALSTAALTNMLSEIDSDYTWNVWPTEVNED